ncbi:class I SAM-dependent methyltransferase [Bradyrhizobium sediminis]|uniref:Class I SAM-dependent methyltransferase n=1 Tax=Bradyrhizobium sediminis TaxID=2840469 RepID=A0A975P0A9_9BRAD|nr:class I SAM-dependent methyltransferase [Bradyrhizobium sediminis]QWG24056.1 class I SAM-dependent methyltransferase [Bradyrhizobium sediminis]
MTAKSAIDGETATAAVRAQWNQMAKGWSDAGVVIRPWLQEATLAMLGMAGVKPGCRVLDVAAGAGDQTLDVAAWVGPQGHVLATDLSPDILQFAAQQAAAAGYRNVETRVSDGEKLQIEDAQFDAVVCRLGLMLFGDPLQGLREMARVLKPGGGVCTIVFGAPQANPCLTTLMSVAFRHAGLPQRDPFQPGGLLSLGKPGLIDELFREAGFREIATTRLAAPFRLPTVKDYMDFIRTSAGPVVQIVQRLEPTKAAAAWADMEEALGRYQTPTGWEGPNELLLTAARR